MASYYKDNAFLLRAAALIVFTALTTASEGFAGEIIVIASDMLVEVGARGAAGK